MNITTRGYLLMELFFNLIIVLYALTLLFFATEMLCRNILARVNTSVICTSQYVRQINILCYTLLLP